MKKYSPLIIFALVLMVAIQSTILLTDKSYSSEQNIKALENDFQNKKNSLDSAVLLNKEILSAKEVDRKYEDRFNLLSKNYERELTFREADYQHTFNRILTIIAITFTVLALFIALINFTGINKFRENIEQQANENIKKATSPENISKIIKDNEKDTIKMLLDDLKKSVTDYKEELNKDRFDYKEELHKDSSDYKEKLNRESKIFTEQMKANLSQITTSNAEEQFIPTQDNVETINITKENLKTLPKGKQEAVTKLFNLAIKDKENKKFDSALINLNKAIELNPSIPTLYSHRAEIYELLGNTNEAMNNYNKAVKLKTNFIEAYGNRGNLYGVLKDYKNALKDYNKVLELNPNDAIAYYNRAIIYNELNEYSNALNDYNKAIELKNDYIDALINRGTLYDTLANFDKALDDFTEVIKLDKTESDAYNNRGVAYIKLSEYAKAIDDFKEALKLKPNDASVYGNLGVVYSILEQYQKSVEYFDKALKLDPHLHNLNNARALAIQRMSQSNNES